MKRLSCVLSLVAVAILMFAFVGMMPVSGSLELVETSTESIGDTTVEWASSFEDLDYSVGDSITLIVWWNVLEGMAEYDSFELKMFSPRSIIDRVECEVYSIDVDLDTNTVTVVFAFTNCHWDSERDVEIGNAHFKLYLNVDTDGDGVTDSLAGFGVNVHVEAEGGSYSNPPPFGGPPAWTPGPPHWVGPLPF